MHSAPAVSFPVGRSRFQGWLLAFLATLNVLLAIAWALQADVIDWRQWLVLGLCIATSLVACWQWQHVPVGHLSWDGVMWNWSVGTHSFVVVLVVVIDLQHVVLLRLCATADGNITWVWLDRLFNPLRWMALRRAIYGRGRRGDDPLSDMTPAPDSPLRSAR